MSSRFWASSEDVSADSVDSSVASWSAQEESRDYSKNQNERSHESSRQEEQENRNTAIIPRATGLPDLQPYQRANLFYLSLIEGRCRTQAATTVNASRPADDKLSEDSPEVLNLSRQMFEEVRRELNKVGMLGDEFVGQEVPELHTYLNSFDNILDNIATQQTHNLGEHNIRAFENNSGLLALSSDPSIPHFSNALVTHPLAQQHTHTVASTSGHCLLGSNTSIFNTSNALVPHNFFTTSNNLPMTLMKSYQTLMRQLFPLEQLQDVPTRSTYDNEYKQLRMLGKGGFGAVYKARHKLDDAEYAVKKIIIKAETIQALYDKDNMDELASLIKEVRSMAKFQHYGIVTYHHCWLEPRPIGEMAYDSSSSTNEEEDETESASGDVSFIQLAADTKKLLQHDSKYQRRRLSSSTAAELAAEIDGISFELDKPVLKNNSHSTSTGSKVSHSKSFFKNPTRRSGANANDSNTDDDSDDDSDDDTEDIVRVDGTIFKSTQKRLKYADFDLVMYIKMAPYPLSLHEYISINNEEWFAKHPDVPQIHHCYHPKPTIQLLLSILDGIEYIHRKNIVHRDLKPANILLQILDSSDQPTQGYVNINECQACGNSPSSTYVLPRIGDFGLAHDLSAPCTASDEKALGLPVGTLTYLPPGFRKSSNVCTKLDVYSLGIIAFEMSRKFGTLSERAFELEQLKRCGTIPLELQNHVLRDCILNMVREDVNARWDCQMVRNNLEKVLSQL